MAAEAKSAGSNWVILDKYKTYQPDVFHESFYCFSF